MLQAALTAAPPGAAQNQAGLAAAFPTANPNGQLVPPLTLNGTAIPLTLNSNATPGLIPPPKVNPLARRSPIAPNIFPTYTKILSKSWNIDVSDFVKSYFRCEPGDSSDVLRENLPPHPRIVWEPEWFRERVAKNMAAKKRVAEQRRFFEKGERDF
jgi:hypothetical protein